VLGDGQALAREGWRRPSGPEPVPQRTCPDNGGVDVPKGILFVESRPADPSREDEYNE
jgi:hypothetical protein